MVLKYIPYRKRDSYRPHHSAWGSALAGSGIAFARVDVRGTEDSEGLLVYEYTEPLAEQSRKSTADCAAGICGQCRQTSTV